MPLRPNAAVDLKQLALLYRIAAKTPGLDLAGLQCVADRLYQTPLAQLSRLQLAGLISTLKAIRRGLLDLELVRQPSDAGCRSSEQHAT